LVGLAGGMALSKGKKRKSILSRVPTPKLKAPSVKLPKLSAPQIDVPKPGEALKALGSAAGVVAQRSQQLSGVASEVEKASKAMGNGKD